MKICQHDMHDSHNSFYGMSIVRHKEKGMKFTTNVYGPSPLLSVQLFCS